MRFLCAATLVVLMQAAASAGTMTITGSGTWGASAPTTDLSAPNESWSLSYVVNVPLASDQSTTIVSGEYLLNGAAVNATATGFGFYDTNSFGLFDIFFNDNHTLSFYGAQVYDSSNNLVPGTYDAAIDYDNSNGPNGLGTGTITIGATVPEPSSIVCAGLGLSAALGLSMKRRRRSGR